MIALTEEAQTLLTVVATVDSGRPAPRAHWRAGFCPRLLTWLEEQLDRCLYELGAYLAESTLPKKISSTSERFKPERSTAASESN
jgi:hypothetical protein